MRLTESIIVNNYSQNLNRAWKDLSDLNTKVAAQRRYLKMSETPAEAIKAFGVRKDLAMNSVYSTALSESQGMLDVTESSLSTISDIASEAVDKVLQGVNGTASSDNQKIIAEALRSYQELILSAANAQYADRYLFGGSGFGEKPFSADASGKLQYKGQDMDTTTFEVEHRYIDIGIGLSVASDGTVLNQSGLDIGYSGADLLGSGLDADGLPNNIYNLIGEIADLFESGDLTNISQYQTKLSERADYSRIQYVGIGEKSNYIDFFADRLSREKITDTARQTELEVLSIEEGALLFSEQENMYSACLQMGTKIIQPSLMDYLD